MTKARSKTWNIGETANYGTWRIELKGDALTVQGIRYRTRDVIESRTFNRADRDALTRYLWENMTPYHADQLTAWVDSLPGNP